jgi:hypothetical protein
MAPGYIVSISTILKAVTNALGKDSGFSFLLFRSDQSLSKIPGGGPGEAVRTFDTEKADLND